MQKNIPIPLQCQNKSGIRERPRQNDSREESGDRSRKGKDKNRTNTQRADRSKWSALKKYGAVDKKRSKTFMSLYSV